MKKIDNLKVRKEVYKIGSTILTTMILSGLFGCSKPNVEVEPTSLVASTDIELTPEITSEPTIAATPEITPTPEPTATPYDPYNMTYDDAIMMGNKIYNDWIIRFQQSESYLSNDVSDWTAEDMINFVCLYGGIEPLYPDLRSACADDDVGELMSFSAMCESFATYGMFLSGRELIMLPQSLLFKEGTKEQIFLKEIEDSFDYIINNEVSDEVIYEHWGKIIRFVIDRPLEGELSMSELDEFNWYPLYSTFEIQAEYMKSEPYGYQVNNISEIPLRYIYPERYEDSNASLSLKSMFYSREWADQYSHKGIKEEDYDELAACFWNFADYYFENLYVGEGYQLAKQR